MPDFWLTSGFHLLQRNGNGGLTVTDAFLRAYFGRQELQPIAESCAAERALHAELLADPRRPVPAERLAALADPDARDNYRAVLQFRDLLLAHDTVEGCYLALFRGGHVAVPPLFVDQLAHVILRNLLDGCDDPIRLRAAEALFRSQKVSLQDGAILLADEEVVEMHASGASLGPLERLIADSGMPVRQVDLDVLDRANAALYWERSDRFDMVLNVSFTRPGLDALCRVMEAWTEHFLGVGVEIHSVQTIRDERWAWHIGLDAEASGLLNDLYAGKTVEEARLARLLSLFRLEFRDPAAMLPQVAGRPVYLGMAMTPDNRLRLKPQNLLVNLPLAKAA
ncbi:DUF6352 family protein [Rhodospirillaceae bacterium SYSU D60014]|uniref:DUF6352 family protein n=1 Tax=Virgifigura deserti TaxID=2268457 RepID=UPI000E6762DE